MLSYTFIWGVLFVGIGSVFGMLWLLLDDWSLLWVCAGLIGMGVFALWLSGAFSLWEPSW